LDVYKIIFNEVLEFRNYLRLRYVPFLDLRVPRLALRDLPPIIIISFMRRFLRAEGVEPFVVIIDVFVETAPELEPRPIERFTFPFVIDIALNGALAVAPISILGLYKKNLFLFFLFGCVGRERFTGFAWCTRRPELG